MNIKMNLYRYRIFAGGKPGGGQREAHNADEVREYLRKLYQNFSDFYICELKKVKEEG